MSTLKRQCTVTLEEGETAMRIYWGADYWHLPKTLTLELLKKQQEEIENFRKEIASQIRDESRQDSHD